MSFKDLFFDLDNTILDFDHASHKAFFNTLSTFGYEDEAAYSIYKEGNISVWKEFEEGKISTETLRKKRFQIFIDRMGWSGDGYEWNKAYLEHVVDNTKYLDGAEALLHKLSEKYRIHVVTNGLKEVQRPRMAKADLLPILSSITVSDEIGHAKPQRQFFEVATENAVISDHSKVLMIGDSYSSDIKGGNGFGLKTCWLNASKKEMDSKIHDFEIHSISSLEEILL